jgi:hypothetical protein
LQLVSEFQRRSLTEAACAAGKTPTASRETRRGSRPAGHEQAAPAEMAGALLNTAINGHNPGNLPCTATTSGR